MRTLTLFVAYFGQYMKRRLSFRGDFWLTGIALSFTACFSLALTWAIFQRVEALQGWRYGEVLLINSLAQAASALAFIFFANIFWLPGRYIVDGQLDLLLVRPVNTFLQFLMEEFSAADIVLGVASLAMIAFSLRAMGVALTPLIGLQLALAIVSGALVYGAMLMLAASASFWLKDRVGLLSILTSSADKVISYPVTIFPTTLRWVFSSVFPLAFVAFYPAQLVLESAAFQLAGWLAPVVGIALMGLAYAVFCWGLRTYESSGS